MLESKTPRLRKILTFLDLPTKLRGGKKHTYTTTLNTGSSEEVWVALGIRVLWESYLTYYIDDVEIEIYWAT